MLSLRGVVGLSRLYQGLLGFRVLGFRVLGFRAVLNGDPAALGILSLGGGLLAVKGWNLAHQDRM